VLQACKQVPHKEDLLGSLFVSCVIEGHAGGKEMVRPEAQILMLDKENPAEKQPGSDQQKQSQRDLSGDHHSPQAALRSALRGRAAFVL